MKRLCAFTLVEVLVAIAIVATLAALTFGVMAQSKKAAKRTVDVSNMRQLYTGLMLYEGDWNDDDPHSIADVYGYTNEPGVFCSPADPFAHERARDFPADFCAYTSRRSSFRVSYAYLRSFEAIYTAPGSALENYGATWQRFRDDPRVGMLADPWYMPPMPNSSFVDENSYVIGPGFVYRIRMDGSMTPYWVVTDSTCPCLEDLFLLSKRGAPIVPG
jgi:prepilin-type N-terminal cleavage/methylation domain-containing protein